MYFFDVTLKMLDGDLPRQLDKLQQDLDEFYRTKGASTGCRLRWIDELKKNSKYIFIIEKKKKN